MKTALPVLMWMLLNACVKEKTTTYEAYIMNGTSHQIEIHPYKGGFVHAEDTIRLAPGQTIQIADGTDRGIVNRGGFSSKYFGGSDDSNIIVFDNVHFVTHYANQPTNLNSKYLLFGSTRNIGNPLSYYYEYWDIDRNGRQAKYTYTFVEDDYNFAKE